MFLGTNLEHCVFYHFYFAQAQYPRQKKERRMKNSRFLENSQNHFNFLYRKVRKNWYYYLPSSKIINKVHISHIQNKLKSSEVVKDITKLHRNINSFSSFRNFFSKVDTQTPLFRNLGCVVILIAQIEKFQNLPYFISLTNFFFQFSYT